MKKTNRPKGLTPKQDRVFDIAAKATRKNPVLSKQSSAMRRAWCEGFVNGYEYYLYKTPSKKWYEFWK